MAKVVFCSHAIDALGTAAIDVLRGLGCEVLRLDGDQVAPESSVVFFTPDPRPATWPNSHSRMAAHRFEGCVPAWAATTPFLVGLRPAHEAKNSFGHSVRDAAKRYERWFFGGGPNSSMPTPWEGRPDEYGTEFDSWVERAREVCPSDAWWQMTRSLHPDTGKRKRLGADCPFGVDLLTFFAGADGRHFTTVQGWLRDRSQIRIISPMCIHDNQEGTRVIRPDELDGDAVRLFGRTVAAIFSGIQVAEWGMFTFGDGDYDVLAELGLLETLLPFLQRMSPSEAKEHMTRNMEVMHLVAEIVDGLTPFAVTVAQLHEGLVMTERVETIWTEAEDRAANRMIPVLEKERDLEPIIRQLGEAGFEKRVRQEAVLYLMATCLHGQHPDEERNPTLVVMVERHGGYWRSGRLFEGPNDEFLPVGVLPEAVRQPFGPESELRANHHMQREMADVAALLEKTP